MTVTAGRAWIADYFVNKLYGIEVESGAIKSYDLPVDVQPSVFGEDMLVTRWAAAGVICTSTSSSIP